MIETLQEKIIIKCKECGCTREILPKEIPKGDCQFCEKHFGYYLWINGEEPKLVTDFMPLRPGDIIVINTALPHIINDNEPNFERIFSIEREGRLIYKDTKEGGMTKISSASCEHIYDMHPLNESQGLHHFVLESGSYKQTIEKDWKFCPVCGKEILFVAGEIKK